MSLPKLAFLASETPESQAALGRLCQRYPHHDPEQAEIIVALGGDGFMLQTLHRYMRQNRPIYGMNCGTVGFLMNEYAEDDLAGRLERARLNELRPLRM